MADVTTTFAAKDESFASTVDKLSGRLQGFQQDTQTFSERVGGMASQFSNLVGPLVAVGAAFLGARSLVNSFREAIDMGGKLNDLSQRTGETAGNLAILQRAFENAGLGGDQVGAMLNRLQRFMVEANSGGEQQAKTMNRLALSMEDLRGKTPTEQMKLFADRLSFISDPAERSAIAMQLFGKSGGELLPLLRAMGVELDVARQQLGSYPAIIDRTNAALDTIGDNFNAISAKAREFATGLLVNLAPALVEITDKIAKIDAAGFGMMLSDYAAKMAQAVSAAFNLGAAIDSIKLAIENIVSGNFGEGLSLIWSTMKVTALSALNEIIEKFTAGFLTIAEFVRSVFTGEGLSGILSNSFELVALKFESAMTNAVANILEQLPFISQETINGLRLVSQAAAVEAEAMKYYVGGAAKQLAIDFANAGAAMPQTFAENVASLNPIFDLTGVLAEHNRLLELNKQHLAEMRTSTESIALASTTFSTTMTSATAALEQGNSFSSQIALNLNQASVAAQSIPAAFDLSGNSSEKIAVDLQTGQDAAEQTQGWLEQGSKSTERISIHGTSLAANGESFSRSLQSAKDNISLAVDLMVGPNGLTDRFNEAMKNAQNAQNAIESLRAAGLDDKNMREYQRREDAYQRAYDRRMDDAQGYRERGNNSAANQAERQAKERYTRDELDARYQAHAKELYEKEMAEAKNATTLREQRELELQARKRYNERMEKAGEFVEKTLKEGGEQAKQAQIKAAETFFGKIENAGTNFEQKISKALGGLGEKGGEALALEKTLLKCEDFLRQINEKLPQHALT
jgi:hypothetical protein